MNFLKKIKDLAYKGRQTKDANIFADIYIEADRAINETALKAPEKMLPVSSDNSFKKLDQKVAELELTAKPAQKSRQEKIQDVINHYGVFIYYNAADKKPGKNYKKSAKVVFDKITEVYNLNKNEIYLIADALIKNPKLLKKTENLLPLLPIDVTYFKDIEICKDHGEHKKKLFVDGIGFWSAGIYLRKRLDGLIDYVGQTGSIHTRYHREDQLHHVIEYGDKVTYLQIFGNIGNMKGNKERYYLLHGIEQLIQLHCLTGHAAQASALKNKMNPVYMRMFAPNIEQSKICYNLEIIQNIRNAIHLQSN